MLPFCGYNMRVLKWIIERLEGAGAGAAAGSQGVDQLFGISPSYDDITWTGLDFSREQYDTVSSIDKAAWTEGLKLHFELFQQLAYHLPKELQATKSQLETRLSM